MIDKLDRIEPIRVDGISITGLQRFATSLSDHEFELCLNRILFGCINIDNEFDFDKIASFERALVLLLDSFKSSDNWLNKLEIEGDIENKPDVFVSRKFYDKCNKKLSGCARSALGGYISYLFFINSKYYDVSILEYITGFSTLIFGMYFTYNSTQLLKLVTLRILEGKVQALFWNKKRIVLAMLKQLDQIKN